MIKELFRIDWFSKTEIKLSNFCCTWYVFEYYMPDDSSKMERVYSYREVTQDGILIQIHPLKPEHN